MSTLQAVKVVEVRCGTGALGAAMTTALPAMLLANAGAQVTVIQTDGYDATFDEDTGAPECWDRSKAVEVGPWSSTDFRRRSRSAVADADVVLFAGDVTGEVFRDLGGEVRAPDGWVVVDCPPSDWEIVVQAQCGLTSLVAGERFEPTFSTVPMAGYGTALTVYCAALSILYVKDGAARPQFAFATTMAEGLAATQAMLLRTVEHPRIPVGPSSTRRWQYRCADDVWVHLNLIPERAKRGFRDLLAELGADGRVRVLDFSDEDGDGLVRSLMESVDSATLLGMLSRHAVPGQPALSPAQAFTDVDFARNMLVRPGDGRSAGTVGPASRLEDATDGAGALSSGCRAGSLPLAGITVLDAGAYVAGPYGTFILGQLGARVIKVESSQGDPLRQMPDIFAVCNAGKESVAVDFDAPGSDALLRDLIRQADVLQHNVRPSTAARLGLDEESCRSVNPGIVYSRLSAFGALGARAAEPGFDQTFQAVSGIELAFGGTGRPLWHPSAMCDIAAGWLSAAGVIEGLIRRRRTRRGVSVDTAAVAGGLMAVSGLVAHPDSCQVDSRLRGVGPRYRLYGCGDGLWVAVVTPRAPTTANGESELAQALIRLASTLSADAFAHLMREAGRVAVVAGGEPAAPPFGAHAGPYQEHHLRVLPAASRLAYRDDDLGQVEIALPPGLWTVPLGAEAAATARPPRLGQHNPRLTREF